MEGAPARGDLYLEGDRIAAVVPGDPAPPWAGRVEREIDAASYWILPGLIQTHLHLCQTLFRGVAEGRDLCRWLQEVIWPWEAALEPETIALAAEAGIRELLAGGTTTILDMGSTRHTEVILETAARLGIRGFFGPALMDRGPEPARPLLRPGEESLRELGELARRWEGAENGRIRLALCPRFVPSVSDGLWRELASSTEFAGLPIHTHGSETQEEVREVERLTGKTPPAYLAGLDGAQGRIKMAHGVWLSAEDRNHLHRAGTAVVHCPGSNLKLASGLADVRTLRREGITVGLGADGAACNNRLDAFSELRLAGYIQGLLHGPESVSAAEILRLVTLEGARVLGLEDQIGSLKAGKCADLVLLDPHLSDNPWAAGDGWESPEAFLVFAGGRELVRETWIAGRPVYRREANDLVDEAQDRNYRAARRRLAERAGYA
jgi:5-methylthioadenosine/S-adenosylhomocysteine deaminase